MRGENWCFSAIPPQGFPRHRESGNGSLVSLCVFSDLMERLSRLANRSDVFNCGTREEGEEHQQGGLRLPEHTPASSRCLRFFFHRLDCHQQLPDVIAAANTSRRQQPRGKWVVRGTPQGATSSNRVAITTANIADTWFQQDLTRSGDNSHSSPTPGIPRDKGAPRSLAGMKIHTSDFCPAVCPRRVHITSVRGGSPFIRPASGLVSPTASQNGTGD